MQVVQLTDHRQKQRRAVKKCKEPRRSKAGKVNTALFPRTLRIGTAAFASSPLYPRMRRVPSNDGVLVKRFFL
jgi:hypothetical protein